MNNDMQKYVQGAAVKTYRFTTEERLAMARAACGHLPNAEVITAGGMLIDLVDRVGADFIIKGVRNAVDFEYEQKHALYNRAHNPRAETLYMPADPAYDGISSTLARACLERGESLEGILPEAVISWIEAHSRA
jgi:pantetheine-phosphate adenylyltransferase